jgi:hypothetical protein
MDWVEISLLVIFGIALVVEAIALLRGDRPISGAARADARLWAIWPWGWGVLGMHFWYPWRTMRPIPLIVAAAVILACDGATRLRGERHSKWTPITAFVLGMVFGATCWAQGAAP